MINAENPPGKIAYARILEYRGPLIKNAQGNAVNANEAKAPAAQTSGLDGNKCFKKECIESGKTIPIITALTAFAAIAISHVSIETMMLTKECHADG